MQRHYHILVALNVLLFAYKLSIVTDHAGSGRALRLTEATVCPSMLMFIAWAAALTFPPCIAIASRAVCSSKILTDIRQAPSLFADSR